MKKLIAILAILLVCIAGSAIAITPKEVARIERIKEDAAALLRQGKFEEATPLLNEILALDPQNKTAARYLALVRMQTQEPLCKEAAQAFQEENYAMAIDIWDKLLKMTPDDRRFSRLIEMTRDRVTDKKTNELYENAEQLIKDRDYKSAINELEKILAIRPFESRAQSLLASVKSNVIDSRVKNFFERGEEFMRGKKYDDAIGEWKKILEIDPSQEAAARSITEAVREKMTGLYAAAKQAYEQGDYVASRDYYQKILADNPTDIDVRTAVEKIDDVIKVTLKIEEKDAAGDMMRKAIADYIAVDGNRKASMAAAWYASQLSSTSLATAVKDFLERKYASILGTMEGPVGNMNIIDQYLFAALNHIYEGRYDLSIQECTVVIELQPNNILAWKRLGSAYYAIGKKDKARETWEKALKIAPNDTEIKQFIRQAK